MSGNRSLGVGRWLADRLTPLFIARRYLFSRKKIGAINLISGVAVCGVALATMAMVCTLSVFNGFQDLVAGLFTAFDPELKIVPTRGKTFRPDTDTLLSVRAMPEVAVWSLTVEENAIVRYKDRQTVAVIKGVEDNFRQLTAIDSLLVGTGEFKLKDEVVDYGILGVELIGQLGMGLQFVHPLTVYAPRRGVRINPANPGAAFNSGHLFSPGAVFVVNQQKYDARYILAPLAFANDLFDMDGQVTAVELKLSPGADLRRVKQRIAQQLGEGYAVLDRYEQQADVFRIVRIEKLISYLFLTFIAVVACFNIVGSLSMLILDKRVDAATLRSMGASDDFVVRVFLYEGRLIALIGAVAGVVLGLLLCFLQQRFGLVSLGGGSGNYLVDAYPVSVRAWDVALVALTVVVVGWLSVWYPVRYFGRRLLSGARVTSSE